MAIMYDDWVKAVKEDEIQQDYLVALTGIRNDIEYTEENFETSFDEKLFETYQNMGILGNNNPYADVEDPNILLVEHLEKLGSSIEDLDMMNSRFLMQESFLIPIWSSSKQLLFLISYSNNREKGGKYINIYPKELKERVSQMRIYGLENTEQALKEEVMFVVEGTFDKIRLEKYGLPVCTTLGSNITKYHKVVLSRFKKLVYIRDNDPTGNKAAQVFKEMLPHTVMEFVPQKKDIDAFAASDDEEFEKFIQGLKNKHMRVEKIKYDLESE